jgi:hypothetical protein
MSAKTNPHKGYFSMIFASSTGYCPYSTPTHEKNIPYSSCRGIFSTIGNTNKSCRALLSGNNYIRYDSVQTTLERELTIAT